MGSVETIVWVMFGFNIGMAISNFLLYTRGQRLVRQIKAKLDVDHRYEMALGKVMVLARKGQELPLVNKFYGARSQQQFEWILKSCEEVGFKIDEHGMSLGQWREH